MAGQLWATDSLGGYLYSKRLSTVLRQALQPMTKFRQFCDVKDETAQGRKKGDVFTFDVVFDVATQGTTLVETNTVPVTNFTIKQATGSITEYANSVPWTGKLEALAQFDVRRMVMTALSNDAAKVFDSAAFSQFANTPYIAVSTASGAVTFGTASTAGANNTSALYKANLQLIRDNMMERNIPTYDGEHYVCIAHPSTLRALKNDLESVSAYTETGYTKIVNGEIGRYDSVRFVEQTGVAKAAKGAWAQAKSNWAFIFGAETVMEAVAIPEETRAKTGVDYGRDKGVAWYYLGGFKIVHNWGDTGETQTRICAWMSDT